MFFLLSWHLLSECGSVLPCKELRVHMYGDPNSPIQAPSTPPCDSCPLITVGSKSRIIWTRIQKVVQRGKLSL